MNGAPLYLLLLVIAIGSAIGAGAVVAWCMRNTPVDRSENRVEDDARISQVRDSMRGTL